MCIFYLMPLDMPAKTRNAINRTWRHHDLQCMPRKCKVFADKIAHYRASKAKVAKLYYNYEKGE